MEFSANKSLTVIAFKSCRCIFGHTFQLANSLGQYENENESHYGNISKIIGGQKPKRIVSRCFKFNVYRYGSYCSVVHWISFILEHSISGWLLREGCQFWRWQNITAINVFSICSYLLRFIYCTHKWA